MLRLLLATAILASPSAWALPNTLPVTDGLQAWLDAAVGVFTFEGNEVIAWADISGNENDATYNGANSFGESPPLYDSTNPDIGGAASVRFNGANALEFDLGFLVGSDYTIFVVNGRDRFGLANFFIAGNSVATNQNLVLGYETPSLLRQSHFNNDLDVTVETYNGEPVWSIDTFRFSGEDGRDIFHNGEAVASDSNTTPLLANTGTTIGHFRGIPQFFFQGDIAEIVVYNRALTFAERQQVEADLAERHSLPLVEDESGAPEIERDALLGIDAGDEGLIWVDPENGVGNAIGSTGAPSIASLAKNPITSLLYAGDRVSGDSEGSATLYAIDERSGEATSIGSLGLDIVGMRAADFDANGTLWAVVDVLSDEEECPFEECEEECPFDECEEDFGCEYYEDCAGSYEALAVIDLETGEADVQGQLFTDGLDGIAFDSNGTLWGVSSSDDGLYIIDFDDGEVFTEFIGTLFVGEGGPIPAGGFRSLQFACDKTPFDGEPGTLYAGLGEDDGGGGALYVIDTETGSTSPVGEGSATGGSSLSALALHTTCGETISQSPTPEGEDVKVITVDVFEQVADNVVQAGVTDAFFCVLPDTRWLPNGSGGYNFMPANLNLATLAGQGTCSGPLVPGQPETWEADIFPNLNLVVPAAYRSYLGEVTLPGDATPTQGHWLALGVIRSTAEYDGPVSYVTFPEALIDYSATDPNEIPACDTNLAFRNLDIAGAVPAFGDFPNFEGNRMIVQSAQCNRTRSMTRRTTHVFPVRYEYPVAGPRGEMLNLFTQLSGIRGTITEAASCADMSLLMNMQASLNVAQNAIRFGNYGDAVQALEEVARSAKNAESFGNGFSGCDIARNYRGNFMSRAITAAFTVHDRFENAASYVKYFVPADLDIPILDAE